MNSKTFTQKKLEIELKLKLALQTNLNCSTFQAVVLKILNRIASAKMRIISTTRPL